ncbi:MAG: dTDP-4-dehydrorhamnose 3,5-epimerase [Bacteroidetes bacterium]|nr:dTDP-4-dehydrorhamnose 3,5-epimerase [Bacteroidota bacterium]
MEIIKTEIPGLLIFKPKVFEDERGYFFESYNEKTLTDQGIQIQFVQDNQSKSSFGVIRGLHYQLAPYSQTKLIMVLEGEILDVAVDIRKKSPTFGKWYSHKLSAENKKQMLVPAGFAHGFSVLSKIAVVFYKCDKFFHSESERGIMYNDPELSIDWEIEPEKAIISAKDKRNPFMKEAEMNFYL